jgi:hypothetical protein
MAVNDVTFIAIAINKNKEVITAKLIFVLFSKFLIKK